jgi:hypothetical protein
MYNYFRYLLLIVFLASCSSANKPSKILEPQKIQVVFFDMMRIDAFVYQFASKDSSIKPNEKFLVLQEGVLKKHNVSRKQYETSINYYQNKPNEFKIILDSITNIYTREKYKNIYGDTSKKSGNFKGEAAKFDTSKKQKTDTVKPATKTTYKTNRFLNNNRKPNAKDIQ